MLKLSGICALVYACGATLGVRAGESVAPRQEFRRSPTYPYVFRPVCYLATKGPVPLRFDAAEPDCDDRKPPKLPAIPKPEVRPEPAAVKTAPVEAEALQSNSTPPAFPAPTNGPAPRPPAVDFSKFPPELVEAFRQKRETADPRNYLFDPIFQPALPDDLPKSSATYRQK